MSDRISDRRAALAGAAFACLAGCALQPAPVAQVLDASQDQRCADAIAAFRAEPNDVERALDAAHAAFAAADRSVQEALVATVRDLPAPTPAAILAAEAEMPAAVRDRVLALADTGAAAAQAALDALSADTARPAADLARDRVDAEVHLALHLSFVAWANGPMRALFAGYGERITAAMDAALAIDPVWDHGAPLRLKGRFLAQAPWPLRDRDESLRLLQRAVATAPLPIHHLFLGDLLFARGDSAGALAEWQSVLDGEPDDTTRDVAPFHRELARLRLAAATR